MIKFFSKDKNYDILNFIKKQKSKNNMNNKGKKGTTLLNFHIFFFRFKYGIFWEKINFLSDFVLFD